MLTSVIKYKYSAHPHPFETCSKDRKREKHRQKDRKTDSKKERTEERRKTDIHAERQKGRKTER